MRRFLSIILVLQIFLAYGAVMAPYAYGANGDVAAPAAGGEGDGEDRRLRIYLSVPIGTENVGYEKTTCRSILQPDSTSSIGYHVVDFECERELLESGSCEESRLTDDEVDGLKGDPNEYLHKDFVYCRMVQVIEAGSGSGLIKAYTGLIYKWAAGTVGIVAVLVIVVSGIQIITSDVSGDVDSAKNRIGQSLIGLAILFLSAVILYTVNPNFFN